MKFTTAGNLDRHLKRKIACDRSIRCKICNKEFITTRDLKRHNRRKTTCAPIQGNPLHPVAKNTCHFCGKSMASKQSLTRHFNICNIKNNRMDLLFKKVEFLTNEVMTLKTENKELKQKSQNQSPRHNTYINSPHNNTILNIQIQNYGGDAHLHHMRAILKQELPRILSIPVRDDIPKILQVQNRIQQIVSACYRNPAYKNMQNVYVLDTALKKDNAFIYQGGWKLRDWSNLGKELVADIRCHADQIKSKDDILRVMKHIMVLAGGDVPSIEKMSEEQVLSMYSEMGTKLKFNTITFRDQ